MLFPNAKIGDYVTFGTYTQGRYVEDPATPIEWQYIANKDDHKMLLSKYVLDPKPYHNAYEGITWENCDLRKWLNNDFYNTAFSASEKENFSFVWTVDRSVCLYGGFFLYGSRDRRRIAFCDTCINY